MQNERKVYLGVLRDLIQPGMRDINRRKSKNYELVIDFIERKLMISDGTLLVDDDKCESHRDQMDMLKENFVKWRENK